MQRKNWAGALFATFMHSILGNPVWALVGLSHSQCLVWFNGKNFMPWIIKFATIYLIFTPWNPSPKCTQKLSDNYNHARYSLSTGAKTKLSASKTSILFHEAWSKMRKMGLFGTCYVFFNSMRCHYKRKQFLDTISYPCERISLLSSVFLSATSSEMIPGVSNLFLIQSPGQKVQVHQNKLIRKLN